MKSVFISDLLKMEHGDKFESQFRLKMPQVLKTKNGEPFMLFQIADRTGEMEGKWWKCGEERLAEAKAAPYVFVSGTVEIYKGKRQVILQSPPTWLTEPEDPADFVSAAVLPLDVLRQRLDIYIASVTSRPLQTLLQSVFGAGQLRTKFERAPAAQMRHHACRHGLLQHTLEVTDLAAAIASSQNAWGYAAVSRDLAVTGALLHDIGKIFELTWTEDGDYSSSRRGQFLGHTMIGVQILVEKMKGIPGLTEDYKDALLHIMASHHGKMEFGASVTPKFAEALIVHMADDLSVKLFYMDEAVANADSEFVKSYKLDNQIVYGHRIEFHDRPAEAAPMISGEEKPDVPLPPLLPVLRFRTTSDTSSDNTAFHTRRLPLVGRAAAGEPIYADSHIDDYFDVEDQNLRGDDYYLLRVKGNSMTGDGIVDSDMIVYHSQAAVEAEDIAVVCVSDDEAAIKRVHRTAAGISLISSNPEHAPLAVTDPDSLRIRGKVVGILRN